MKKRLSIQTVNVRCAKWLDVLDELNIGAFIVDYNRMVAAMNLSAQALMGLRQSEAVGKDCREVFVGVPCFAQCMFRRADAVISEDAEVEIQDEMLEKHLVTRLAAPIYDNARQLVGCMTILQDQKPIADLVERIHYEERSLKMILDNMDIAVFTVDLGGYITFFNQTAERISGYGRREVLGKSCTAVFRGESQGLNLLKETMTDGAGKTGRRGRLVARDGETIPIRASYMALKNEKGAIVGGLATFQDLTLAHQLDQAISDRYTFSDMIGKSPAMQRIFEKIRVVAATAATVLIEGATGTGKDVLAKALHFYSPRADKPFVKVNCAAIPDNLLESEMFGYVKGAFTGADQNRPGRFRMADGGTIFLDEIADLPLALQAKLLRVLEDREFYPLGSRHTVKVDVRIVAATNKHLEQLVRNGLFREDLFYRLNVFRIELPALRNRRVDLPPLIRQILRKLCAVNKDRFIDISQDAMKVLLNYTYPGNIRELENILEHALIVCGNDIIRTGDLPEYMMRPNAPADPAPASTAPELAEDHEKEKRKIMETLQRFGWRRGETAAALRIDRTTLWRKMKKYKI